HSRSPLIVILIGARIRGTCATPHARSHRARSVRSARTARSPVLYLGNKLCLPNVHHLEAGRADCERAERLGLSLVAGGSPARARDRAPGTTPQRSSGPAPSTPAQPRAQPGPLRAWRRPATSCGGAGP